MFHGGSCRRLWMVVQAALLLAAIGAGTAWAASEPLKKAPPEQERMSLPVPEGKISVEQLLAAPPGVQKSPR